MVPSVQSGWLLQHLCLEVKKSSFASSFLGRCLSISMYAPALLVSSASMTVPGLPILGTRNLWITEGR
jgi:hypothetical protein